MSLKDKKGREEKVPMFRSFADHKIEELGKGFEATHQLEDLKKNPPQEEKSAAGPTLCDDGSTPITDDLFKIKPYDAAAAERTGYSNYSYWRSTLQVFLKKKVSVFILIFLVVLLAFTFIQPHLPNQKDPYVVNNDPETGATLRNVQPNEEFWFGTNNIGQDLWSRLWSGTRTSLFIGLCVAVCNMVVGLVLGSIWGYARKMDWLFTEIYNLFDNIPYTILRMLLIYIMRPSLKTMIFVMCLTGWIGMSKYIRNQILIYRDREYHRLPHHPQEHPAPAGVGHHAADRSGYPGRHRLRGVPDVYRFGSPGVHPLSGQHDQRRPQGHAGPLSAVSAHLPGHRSLCHHDLVLCAGQRLCGRL